MGTSAAVQLLPKYIRTGKCTFGLDGSNIVFTAGAATYTVPKTVWARFIKPEMLAGAPAKPRSRAKTAGSANS